MNASAALQYQALAHEAEAPLQWQALCDRHDLVAHSGVVAWHDKAQVALFYLPDDEHGEQIYAIENKDPKSGANVIGRGIIGQIKGQDRKSTRLNSSHVKISYAV